MDVVYVFFESDLVRIPFFDVDRHLFRLLASVGGGIWDNGRQEFVFKRDAGAGRFGKIAFYVPCVFVGENPSIPLRVSGFWEFFRESCDSLPVPEDAGGREISGACGGAECFETGPPAGQRSVFPAALSGAPHAVFSLGPLPPPEKFTERWQERLDAELRSRKYSPRTRRCYIYYNRLLCRTLGKIPEEIRPDDLTRFLATVERDREYSASSMNLAISAVKFFYREVMKNDSVAEQHRPRNDGRLPQILSKAEIGKILGMEGNPKHRLLMMLVYSSGLRVSEVVSLKKEHVDAARGVLYVRQGKGRKDRCTLLSEKASRFIAEYCAFYGIRTWLFPGQPPTRPLTIRSAQHIFEKAVRRAGIAKKITIHGLRHAFATHLLEGGTDIRYIQTLLGHASLRTTERYTHVARRSILSIKSPLDTMP